MTDFDEDRRVGIRREDDYNCSTHQQMVNAMVSISRDLKWHNRIGHAVFIVGCTTIVVGLSALIYFGKLSKQVEINSMIIDKLLTKIEKVDDKVNSLHNGQGRK